MSLQQCGPASGVDDETCLAIGREKSADRYSCSGAYALGEYAECEVGDLSGKDGALVVGPDGRAGGGETVPSRPDPLAALNSQFVNERVATTPDKWASVIFHDGSPRVLCAKIFQGEPPAPPSAPTAAPTEAPITNGPDPCQLEFILFDADEDVALRPLEAVECAMGNEFNIQARPSDECSTTVSADMQITGPISEARIENAGPYMVFGDSNGNIFGRAYQEGEYTISASIFSESSLGGDLVVEGTFDFTVVDCRRRLRARA